MDTDRTVAFDINWRACIQCGACVAVCPQPGGFVTPFDTIATRTPCHIACMRCEPICPVSAITHERWEDGEAPARRTRAAGRGPLRVPARGANVVGNPGETSHEGVPPERAGGAR